MSDGHAPQALPAALEATGFFGRSDELAEVIAAVTGGWRLITLVGPPGVGKTRLAQRVARDLEMPVPFVALADVQSRDRLVASVGAALGVSLAAEPRGSAAAAVGRALARAPRPVIVLDNFEQLADDADVLAAWLDAAPRACFIATSRARLRVPGERVVEVGPLSVAAGVALFEERARAPLGRALSDDERGAAERVVRRLDGIPLAIELAAGRAATLGIPDVLLRLEAGPTPCIELLRGKTAGGAARHSSAHAAVSWSWTLLSDDEKRAIAQASVFRGGFVLEAAEAVVDLARGAVMDAVQGLRERSLLWARREPGGSVRFGLFEIVRDFAREQLETGAFGAIVDVEDRHARCFAARGAELAARAQQTTAESHDALERLLADADNLEAAFAHTRDDALVASLALSLSVTFRRRGARAAHEAVLMRGLEAARGSPTVEIELLQARASCASVAGDNETALACQDRALVVADAIKDAGRHAFARARRGWDLFELGRVDDALHDLNAAVDEAAKIKDVEREAYARGMLGLALFQCGSTSSALEELSRAATLAAHTRDRWLRQKTLVDLARAHRRTGALEPAAQRLLEVSALGAAHDRYTQAALALEHAALARAWGRADDALGLLDHALALADDSGVPRARAAVRTERAATLLDLARTTEALAVLDDALAIAARVTNPSYRADALLEIARGRSETGDLDGARAALDLADQALAQGKDAATEGAILVERAILVGFADESKARTLVEDALAVLQRVGGRPLVVGLCVAGMVDAPHVDERRTSAESLLPRFADVEARAAFALLRGQAAPEAALGRRLVKLRGGRARREIVIGGDGRFYELDGQRVSLQRQRSLRLILMALVDHAEKAPGIGMSQTEVLARGWPGEKMRPDSGATRVYTSIRRLRRGGLAGVLLTRDDGYLLDPSVSVRRG